MNSGGLSAPRLRLTHPDNCKTDISASKNYLRFILKNMQLSRYAFIVKAPGYFPEEHTAEIRSQEFSATIVGAPDQQTAILVAQKLITDGIQMIELCGGFTESEAGELRRETRKKIPFGVVKENRCLTGR